MKTNKPTLKMTIDYQDSIALVTGSNRGIGRGIVLELLNRGAAKVYAAARNTDALSDLVSQYGERVVPITLDVTDAEQVATAAAQATDVSILVNNAGVAAMNDLFGDPLEEARRQFEVNYWGTLYMTRAFVPILKANGGGSLINISSVAALTNFPNFPTYSDSKAAVHSLTSGARLLLAGENILTTGVYPGPVDTDMAKDIEMEKYSVESVAAAILDGVAEGKEEIFPDPVSQGFAQPYEAGHKTLERTVAQMIAEPA